MRSAGDAVGGVAFDPWLDDDTAERLLSGRIAPEDAPPGYAPVARLIGAVAAEPSERELAAESNAVAVASALLRSRRPSPEPAGAGSATRPIGRRGTRGLPKVKVAALAVVATLVATAGLAAAGALPEPVRDIADRVLSSVGIDLPGPSSEETSGEADEAGGGSRPGGGVAGQPDRRGNRIAHIATTTAAKGAEKGARISREASGGKSQAGEHGKREGTGRKTEHGKTLDEAHPGDGGRPTEHGTTVDEAHPGDGGRPTDHGTGRGRGEGGERGGGSGGGEHGPGNGRGSGGRSGGRP